MIVPMKKVSLIVLDREKRSALRALRKAGVIHLQDIEGAGEELTAQRLEHTKLENALSVMADLKPQKKLKNVPVQLTHEQALEKAAEISALFAEKKACVEEILKNTREIERLQKWGDMDPADFTFLKKKGINLALYEAPSSLYAKLPDTVKTIFVNQDKTECRFILIDEADGRPADLPPEAFAVQLSEKSSIVLRAEIKKCHARIAEISAAIFEFLPFYTSLKSALDELSKKITFSNIYYGMEKEDGAHPHALAWLTGFVPSPQLAALKDLAGKEKWALSAEDPSVEDTVPTQLKNSKFVRLLYPLYDFLGIIPGYREFDISVWFLLFFSIFFAMIFGDAGYGALLLIIGLAGSFASIAKKKPVPLVMQLVILLSATTVVWGTVTCSWFGIDPDYVPSVLRNCSIWAFNGKNPDSGVNIRIFGFVLALIQLSIGHLIALCSNTKQKSLKLLADIGSLGILWGMANVVLNLLISSEMFPMSNITFGLIGGGFLLSFVFANYEGSIGKSIVSSLANIISVFLGVINFFSDITSYIRLWAVGLAGATIAQTVNSMAGPLLGNFLVFLGVILLLFGHSFNILLNVLSVIVHGVRLNTLEFTSHVGMAWSGFKYEPFKE